MNDKDRMEFIQILREQKKKITPQRIAIFELLRTRKDHPTAEEIYKDVKIKYPSISMSTIYQVLDLLQELGWVNKIKSKKRDARYETNTTPHVNLICPECDNIEDYHSKTIDDFWSQIEKEFEFKLLNKRIDVYRTCKKCKNKKIFD